MLLSCYINCRFCVCVALREHCGVFYPLLKSFIRIKYLVRKALSSTGSAFEAFEIISVTVAPVSGVIFTDAAPIFTSSAKAVKAPSNPKRS